MDIVTEQVAHDDRRLTWYFEWIDDMGGVEVDTPGDTKGGGNAKTI